MWQRDVADEANERPVCSVLRIEISHQIYLIVGGKQLDQKTLKMRLDRMTRSTQEQFEVHLI